MQDPHFALVYIYNSELLKTILEDSTVQKKSQNHYLSCSSKDIVKTRKLNDRFQSFHLSCIKSYLSGRAIGLVEFSCPDVTTILFNRIMYMVITQTRHKLSWAYKNYIEGISIYKK